MLTDAVLLWAYTANKTIENGERPNNGTQFITNVLNTTVEGVAGTIDIDGNGVRLQNFGVGHRTMNRFIITVALKVSYIYS